MIKNEVNIKEVLINLVEHEATFNFPETFFAFRGNFPNQAILPGFISMATIELAVPLILRKELTFKAAKKVKFTGKVKPEQNLTVRIIKTKEDELGLHVNVVAKCENVIVTKAQLLFQ